MSVGLNLPPTQGTTNAGAFLPGVHAYDYGVDDVAALRLHGFTAVRFPVNCSTALDPASMRKLLSFVQALGGHGIVCLFEERAVDAKGDDHGCGRIEDPSVAVAAWTSIHRTFAPHEGVMYELFNEPFGYTNPSEYLVVMRHIIRHAALPVERCMLDGCGYASDVVVLSQIGWEGQMAYHFYPHWLPETRRTERNYARKVLADLTGVASRVYITEFGAALNCDHEAVDTNCLRGLRDGLLQLADRGQNVRGAFHWHGWHNGDSYDIWSDGNRQGARQVQSVLEDVARHRSTCAAVPVARPRPPQALARVPLHIFRKHEMSYLLPEGDGMLPHMGGWGWQWERVCCDVWVQEGAGLVPMLCFRKGESALYCNSDWDGVLNLRGLGWTYERTSFHARAPGGNLGTSVHEWRKNDLTYYTLSDWESYDCMEAWGWTYNRVAFHV